MKKSKKIILIIIIVVVVAITTVLVYFKYSNTTTRTPFSVIPETAIYIIETNNLSEGWKTISESAMWKNLTGTEYFKDINKSAAGLDSLIKDNNTLDLLLKNREMLVSVHMTSGISYDFIFTIDLKKASKMSFINDYLKNFVRLFDYSMDKEEYDNNEIIALKNIETNEVLYITFIDNLLICSYSNILVENSILQSRSPGWEKNLKFREVAMEISNRKLFNFYFNYLHIERYLKLYLSEESEMAKTLSNSLCYSAFNVNLENNMLNFDGYTNINDTVSSYLKALSQVSPGKMRAYDIVTDQAALYISLCFDDFGNFYNKLIEEYSTSNPKEYKKYNSTINKIQKRLKIDLEKDFFSWIGSEIAFIKPRPSSNVREQDVIIAFHSEDIDDAKEGLARLTEQVNKKLPMKFEVMEYHNFEINYLDIGGFFKLLFGKMFGKLEKPYFTYIDDYVVFSNSPTILINFIDDYTKGNTLSHVESFMDFKDDFDNKSNLNVFIQMPKLYSHLYYYSRNDKRNDVKKNKDVIVSFARIGFQLSSNGRVFKTTVKAEYDENTLINEELEKFEAAADELYNKEYESLDFKIKISDISLDTFGRFTIYYDDSTIKAEGKIRDENINGLIRSYYPSGNIMSAVNYIDGAVDGIAIFYHDNMENTQKSEVQFDMDQIVDLYKEFYKNGSRKALLYYENGKVNGDAEFYYKSGVLKMEGQYKRGLRKGKWKHYSETGQLLDKEKWKEGIKK